jgi:transcriptional regulator MraZ
VDVFCGEYNVNLDDKGRIALPSKIRPRNEDGTSQKLMLAAGMEGCLALHTPESWNETLSSLSKAGFTSRDLRVYKRYLFSKAAEVTPDKQGRFLIPNNLISFAGLNDKVLVIGVETLIEIWNPATYEASISNSVEVDSIEDIVERVFNGGTSAPPPKDGAVD